ncbi:MAG: protease inhibitor I42 family protein [Nitrospirota bacterium]
MNEMYERRVLTAAIVVVVLLFNLLAVTGSAVGGDTKNTKGKIAITKKDNGGRFKIKTGCLIYIGLAENGSTGYAWYFDKLDMEYFEELKDKSLEMLPENKTGTKGKPVVGAPMLATWMLMAKKKGQSELKLLNYRIWEGPQTAVDTFTVTIEIE